MFKDLKALRHMQAKRGAKHSPDCKFTIYTHQEWFRINSNNFENLHIFDIFRPSYIVNVSDLSAKIVELGETVNVERYIVKNYRKRSLDFANCWDLKALRHMQAKRGAKHSPNCKFTIDTHQDWFRNLKALRHMQAERGRSTLRTVNLMSMNIRNDSELNSEIFENSYFLSFFDQVERSMPAIWPEKSPNLTKMST